MSRTIRKARRRKSPGLDLNEICAIASILFDNIGHIIIDENVWPPVASFTSNEGRCQICLNPLRIIEMPSGKPASARMSQLKAFLGKRTFVSSRTMKLIDISRLAWALIPVLKKPPVSSDFTCPLYGNRGDYLFLSEKVGLRFTYKTINYDVLFTHNFRVIYTSSDSKDWDKYNAHKLTEIIRPLCLKELRRLKIQIPQK